MLRWFRRKKDDKSMAMNAEQEVSTIKKMDMADQAMKKLNDLHIERRFQIVPVDFERRKAHG